MGCTTSRPTDDIADVCNERIMLIQKAINHREEFSDAHHAYIESLADIASALRLLFGRGDTFVGFPMVDSPAPVLGNFQSIFIDSNDITPHANTSPGSSLSTRLSSVSKLIIDDYVLPTNPSPMSSLVSPELPMMNSSLSPPISHPHALTPDGNSLEEEGEDEDEAVDALLAIRSSLRRTESLPEFFTHRVGEFYDDDDDDDDEEEEEESDSYSFRPPSSLLVDSPRFSFDTFTPPVIPEHLREQRRMKKLGVNGNIIHDHSNVKEDQQMHVDVGKDEGMPDLEEIGEMQEEVRQDTNDDNQEIMPEEVEKRVVSEDKSGISPISNEGFDSENANNESLSNMNREMVIAEELVKENTTTLLNDMASPRGINVSEMINHISDQFVKASKSGEDVSIMLETQTSQDLKITKDSLTTFNAFRSYWSQKASVMMQDMQEGSESLECGMAGSHTSTLERLLAWEKKLYDEVKGGEFIRGQFDQKCKQLRLLDARDAKDTNIVQREKMRVSLRKLDTRLMVALKAIQGTSKKIRDLTNAELFPQLCELLEGCFHDVRAKVLCEFAKEASKHVGMLATQNNYSVTVMSAPISVWFMSQAPIPYYGIKSAKMWKAMRDCHRAQEAISLEVSNLEYMVGGSEVVDDSYRNDVADLRHELDMWRRSFRGWFFTQLRYINALCAWLEKCYEKKDELRDETSSKRMKNAGESYRDPVFHLLISWRGSLEALRSQQKWSADDGVTTFVVKLDSWEESISAEIKLKKHDERARKKRERRRLDDHDDILEASSSFTTGIKANERWQRARLDALNSLWRFFTSLSGFADDATDLYEKVKSKALHVNDKDNENDDM